MADFGTMLTYATVGLMLTSVSARAENPDWILKGSMVQASGKIIEVSKTEPANLVSIDMGLRGNFRIGANCTAIRIKDSKAQELGNLIIVDARADKSIAMVLKGAELKSGDAVYITPAN